LPDSQIPRVCMLTGSISLKAGGIYDAVRIPANILAGSGANISVLSQQDDRTGEAVKQWRTTAMRIIQPIGPRGYGSIAAYLRALREIDPQIVHLSGIWLPASLAAYRWQRQSQAPLLISPHGMLDERALQFSRLRKLIAGRLFERRGILSATAMHALNESEAGSMRAFGFGGPIAIIPNGIEIGDPPPDENRGESLGDSRVRRLLFLGRIHPKKGLSQLLDGWSRFRKSPAQSDRWQLDIAGWDDGGHLNALRRQAAQLGLEDSVNFLGPLYGEDKAARLRGSDAFILPTFSEGLPVAVLEAWEAGLPVITTDFSNLPIGFARRAAIRTSPDGAAIAEALEQLAALSDEERRQIGMRGRQLVIEEFDWQQISKQFAALYQWLHHGGDAPEFVRFQAGL